MKSVFAVFTFAALAAAADSYNNTTAAQPLSNSTAAAAATPSPNIPNVSQGCNTFLNSLNSAPDVHSCVQPVLNALATSTTSTPDSVCSAITSSSCPDTAIRKWITNFKISCNNEVISGNDAVSKIMDVLYVIRPFTNAFCSKDLSGVYCINKLVGNNSTKSASDTQNVAQVPLTTPDGSLDTEAFSNTRVLFLGIDPQSNPSTLCTACTKNVLTSYMTWESDLVPPMGFSGSHLLTPQSALWTAVQQKCPSEFVSGALSNVGGNPEAANAASSSYPGKGAAVMLALVAAGIMSL